MDQLRFNLIGPVAVYLNDRPLNSFRTNLAKALLIYLATEAAFADSWPVLFRREQLADLLWPGATQKSAQDSFRQALYQLRKAILPPSKDGPGGTHSFVGSDRHTIWIGRDASLHSDVAQLRALARSQDEEACFQACQLIRGQFLDSFVTPTSLEYDIWVANRRDDVHRLMAGCLRSAAALQLARRDYPKAEQAARRLMALDPYDEAAVVQLIQIQLAVGSRTAALGTYDQFCAGLLEGLDADPSQELQDLAQHARHTYRWQPPELTNQPPASLEPHPSGLTPSAADVPHFVGRAPELPDWPPTCGWPPAAKPSWPSSWGMPATARAPWPGSLPAERSRRCPTC